MKNINGCTVVDPSEIDGSFNLTGEDTGGAFSALIGTIPTAWNAGSEDVRGIIFIVPGDVEHEFVEV
jgi:hypothetical protein